MKIIFLLILCYLSSSCNKSSTQQYEIPNYEKMADKITAQVARRIERETGLRLIGTGGGMMDHVRMMAMSFDQYGEITMEKGRELIIYCIQKYLSAINEDIEIRSYLVHYPFTPKDVEVRIFIYKQDRREVAQGVLSIVNEVGGMVKYKVNEPGTDILKTVHRETYEEAVEILESEGDVSKVRTNSSYIDVIGKLKYGKQLQMLEPHPNASFWDHVFLNQTFEPKIKDCAENYGGRK
jgi:hypothetical protein